MSLRKFFATNVSRFRNDQRGGVAVTFALTALTIVGVTGIAVDYANAELKSSRMQTVADLASLAAAQSQNDDDAELRTIADAVFANHFGADSDVTITNVVRTGDAVTVQASSESPTTLSRVFGYDALDVNVSATSLYSVRSLDMALVLDTTNSMRGAKLDSLKRAAGQLVDTIDELDDEGVRLSVVPFTNHVNVGTSRRNAAWLDVPADETRTRWVRVEGTARNCRQESGTWDDDGNERTWSGEVCDYDYEEEEYTVKWEGCVGSRNGIWDERVAHDGRDIPGILGKKCGREIQPLTANMSTVGATIQGLSVQSRKTYMPAGLLWGWRALDNSAPLVNTDDSARDRVLVLMSDGDNTTSKSGATHEADKSTANRADRKTERLCEAAKDAGVTIYTIAFQIDDADTRDMLSACATDPGKSYDARNENQLTEAFDNIADSVKELRVSA